MARHCTHQINSINLKENRVNGAPNTEPDEGLMILEAEPLPVKKDHPVWGVILTLIVCGTVLLAIQMLVDYHW